jgi:hypothetical protein
MGSRTVSRFDRPDDAKSDAEQAEQEDRVQEVGLPWRTAGTGTVDEVQSEEQDQQYSRPGSKRSQDRPRSPTTRRSARQVKRRQRKEHAGDDPGITRILEFTIRISTPALGLKLRDSECKERRTTDGQGERHDPESKWIPPGLRGPSTFRLRSMVRGCIHVADDTRIAPQAHRGYHAGADLICVSQTRWRAGTMPAAAVVS